MQQSDGKSSGGGGLDGCLLHHRTEAAGGTCIGDRMVKVESGVLLSSSQTAELAFLRSRVRDLEREKAEMGAENQRLRTMLVNEIPGLLSTMWQTLGQNNTSSHHHHSPLSVSMTTGRGGARDYGSSYSQHHPLQPASHTSEDGEFSPSDHLDDHSTLGPEDLSGDMVDYGEEEEEVPGGDLGMGGDMMGEEPICSQTDMVEAVKRHILNMLHLSARPNVTQPVPRAALLNAIRKLQVGRVAEDGSVQIQEEGPRPGETEGGPLEPPAEIITFAEPGDSPSMVTFDITKEGSGSSVVEQANVWVFLKLARGNRAKGKVTLQLLQTPQRGAGGAEIAVSEKVVDTRRSGWHTLPVPRAVQALLDGGDSVLHLRVSCPLCADVGATPLLAPADGEHAREREQSHRPFLMVVLREAEEPSHRRDKRGLECDGTAGLCCKRQFYVNFKDIGWSDWIIAPPGYHANYCEGDCPSHAASITGSSLSFHSTVISHYRMRGYGPFQNIKSCCVPTRLRPMSMLYYNEEQMIIKKDIQNMIVDECGCS